MTRLENTDSRVLVLGRRWAIATALALTPATGLTGLVGAQVAPNAGGHCLFGSRLFRGLVGGGLGGWVGFVVVKIKLSDWNDANRSGAANRTRMQATLAGAAVGATIGALLPHACERTNVLPSRGVLHSLNQPITSTEIARAGVSGTAYDIVYTLRRTWLNTRGVEDFGEAPRTVTTRSGQELLVGGEPKLIIYLDNMRLGTVGELHNIPATGVLGIRFYTPAEANYRWGAGHTHGAIQVLTVVEEGSP